MLSGGLTIIPRLCSKEACSVLGVKKMGWASKACILETKPWSESYRPSADHPELHCRDMTWRQDSCEGFDLQPQALSCLGLQQRPSVSATTYVLSTQARGRRVV